MTVLVAKQQQQQKVFCNWEVDDGWFVLSGNWLMENLLANKNKLRGVSTQSNAEALEAEGTH